MTEVNEKNKKAYLELCEDVWNLDKESMEYIKNRLSDDWKPVSEFDELFKIPNSKYEDQRIIIDLNMSNPATQEFFEKDDQAYKLFKEIFSRAISCCRDDYNCNINYKEFIENKVVFRKNVTKIKKVFETIYAENNKAFEYDFTDYSPEVCSEKIVKAFERIGSYKKSAKKLKFVISFNPMDWLLASTAEKFSSCFNLDNKSGGYSYCLGLPFLCGDKNRMMLYISSGEKKNFMGIEVDSVMSRTWCILDKSGTFNIVKWYPNDVIPVESVNAITGNGNFVSRNYFKGGKYPLDVISTKKGAVIGVYSDMGRWEVEDNKLVHVGNGKDGQQYFTKNLLNPREISDSSFRFNNMNLSGFSIDQPGYRVKEWKKLGLHVDLMFPTAKCVICKDDTKGGFFTKEKGFVCYTCYKENICSCISCGEIFNKKEATLQKIKTTSNKIVELCESCLKKACVCSCCGRYFDTTSYSTDDEKRICMDCIEKNNYCRCDDCGSYSKSLTAKYNPFEKTLERVCSKHDNESSSEYSTFGRDFRIITKMTRGEIE